MTNCPNCNKKIGCSCKIRRASDGKACCTSCITTYEMSINKGEYSIVNAAIVTTTANLPE